MTELCFPTLVSAEKKTHFKKIPFLVLDLKVQQAKKTPACYCMSPGAAETVKVGAAAAQPWSLRQEATLYAGASFDTFTEMCHEACLGSHFAWFVTPYMAPVQQQCPNWLHSFVLVQFCLAEREFCAILHQFPILAAFLHKTIFLRTQLHSCARAVHRRLNAPQCSWHCHFHVNNPLNIRANDRALVHNI